MKDQEKIRETEKKGMVEKKKKEERIDEQLEQTFPASDPPSYSKPGNDFEEE